jgi:hypothetical protein
MMGESFGQIAKESFSMVKLSIDYWSFFFFFLSFFAFKKNEEETKLGNIE